ncbi:MAG: hypothetical protein E7Z64_00740 [Thermoplasmata archaeon]|nr:hypothetical protein [Thermoplasmata archaeon]
MIGCRRGVISLPVKLAISFMVIALTVPMVFAAVENVKEGMDDSNLNAVSEQLRDNISKVHSRSPNFSMQFELEIPDGCHLAIGGDEGMVIRMYKDDRHMGNILMDSRVLGDELILHGDVLLRISNDGDGVRVTEL